MPERTRYDRTAPRLPEGDFHLGDLLSGSGDLELDVGFGRGLSVIERARAAPTSRVLGIEIKYKWAYKVAERLERERITNARVFGGDVADLLRHSVGGPCLQRVFIHFPDPWWKKRHAKRRVVGRSLLDGLGRVMWPGGELFIQTDVEARAEEYRAELERHPAFDLGPVLGENPYGVRSSREVRAVADGLPIFRILARRVQ